MKKLFVVLACLFVLAGVVGSVFIQVPVAQNKLMDRVITDRMNSVPEHLFKDDALRAVLCGSAAPMPIKDRAAACVMIIAGGKYYIVDAGNRSTNNLGLWRIPSNRIGGVFISHFHSDHIGELGEFNMMSWAQGRPAPLDVYGPKGIEQVVDGFSKAYALDRDYRTEHHGAEYLNPEIGKMVAHVVTAEPKPATVLEENGLKISAFSVEHEPISPALGYRFDYKGRSVVISGDTTKAASVINASKNADVLFHEALAMHIVERMQAAAEKANNKQLTKIMFDIRDYHTSPVEAAEVANEANVNTLVLYHLVPAPPNKIAEKVFMRGVKAIRPEGVILGYDGLTLELPADSEDVNISRLKIR